MAGPGGKPDGLPNLQEFFRSRLWGAPVARAPPALQDLRDHLPVPSAPQLAQVGLQVPPPGLPATHTRPTALAPPVPRTPPAPTAAAASPSPARASPAPPQLEACAPPPPPEAPRLPASPAPASRQPASPAPAQRLPASPAPAPAPAQVSAASPSLRQEPPDAAAGQPGGPTAVEMPASPRDQHRPGRGLAEAAVASAAPGVSSASGAGAGSGAADEVTPPRRSPRLSSLQTPQTPPRPQRPSAGGGRRQAATASPPRKEAVKAKAAAKAAAKEASVEPAKKRASGSPQLKRRRVLAESSESGEEETPPPRKRRQSASPQQALLVPPRSPLPPAALVPAEEEVAEPLRPPAPRRKELRALALTEVPLDSFARLPKAGAEECRPQRRRMPPLEHWRNERVVYERPRGSKVPEVAGVELNLGPRSALDPPRQLSCTALQAPFPAQEKVDNASELIGISTRELESRIFTLTLAQGRRRPQTVKLPPGLGQIHVIDGAIRCAYEGDPAAAELRLATRDTALLRDQLRPVLIAAAELEEGGPAGTSDGSFARFLYVRFKAELQEPERPVVKATPKQSPGRPLKAERASPRPVLQPLPPPAAPLEL